MSGLLLTGWSRVIKWVLIGLSSWLTTVTVSAQDGTIFPPTLPERTLRAVKVGQNLSIDGRLTDSLWQQAPVATGFFRQLPDQGGVVRSETQVRVLFNRKYLYVGFFAADSLGRRGVRVPDLRRDFEYFENDLVGISLDPFRDQRNSIAFQTNPYSAQRDLLTYDDTFFDREWDGFWKVRTARSDSGWTAEMQIPWATLRYPKPVADSVVWGVQFIRRSRRLGEQSSWSPFPRAYTAYRMTYAGRLTGLEPPPPSVNIRVQPYVLTDWGRTLRNGQVVDRRGARPQIGGEVKWAVNPYTILDLTLNTDFAQADVDRQVQNLTRFSVFFPERRQFFLENATTFAIGSPGVIQPFFSRRIGLSDAGSPIPLDAGVRLVNRTSRQNAGVLLVRQRALESSPAATFAVARYSRNIGRQNRIGGLITTRFDEASGVQPASANYTVSVDGFVRFSDPFSWNVMVSRSAIAGYRADNQLAAGWSAVSNFEYEDNHWAGFWTQSVVTQGYAPGVGFVYGTNLVNTNFGGYRITRPRWRPKGVRQIDPGAFVNMYHRASDGRFLQAELEAFPLYVIFVRGNRLYAYVVPTWQRLEAAESFVGIRVDAGRYYYTRYRFNYNSDQSRKLAYGLFMETGRFYDGRLTSLEPSFRYSPVPQVSLAVNYRLNRFGGLGAERVSRTAHLLTPELRLALNPRLQLTGFYQHNSAVDRNVWNVRFAWEFQPLSFLYLVYNSNAQQLIHNGFQRPELTRQEQVIGKITYLKQF